VAVRHAAGEAHLAESEGMEEHARRTRNQRETSPRCEISRKSTPMKNQPEISAKINPDAKSARKSTPMRNQRENQPRCEISAKINPDAKSAGNQHPPDAKSARA
jgi:hypothetical protein